MTSDAPQQPAATRQHYVVVARRYRPQTFEELVGQQHVAAALTNAIRTDRVGHAYLFTGARGIGKTSAARILAKCLNCQSGPGPVPCNQCELCRSIAAGEDVDVLEIDGASNRGIDEIRQLRSNVNIRPSRSRFKIYIIDEVHMLTPQAFNALLKTLEEPPEHVKFIFCTTDPEKIPITVLSRCQRFDFAPVGVDAITQRLRQIVEAEQVEADDEALRLLARRAAGSMRDSQSLLEQLLAFGGQRITSDDVHQMLGTAKESRLAQLVQLLMARDAAAALAEVDRAVGEGVEPGQLAQQLLGYFRDLMAAAVGCDADLMLHTQPGDFDQLRQAGQSMGLETALAAAQILDQTLVRMRQSGQNRVLLEMAIIRICKLEELDQIADLIARLEPSSPAAAPGKSGASSAPAGRSVRPPARQPGRQKKSDPPAPSPQAEPPTVELTPETAERIWRQTLAQMGDLTAEYASHYQALATSAPNQLVVTFNGEYTHHKEACERPERKQRLEQALANVVGHPVQLRLELSGTAPASRQAPPPPMALQRQRVRQVYEEPLVQEAVELFDAEVVDVRLSD